MVQNPPSGMSRIVPRLGYADPGAAIAWLAGAFGFHERPTARVVDSAGRVTLTEMVFDDGVFMIGLAGAHGVASPAAIGGFTAMLSVYVDRVDEHCATARAAGAEILTAPEDMFWGDRRYEAIDLEGHRWAFHEHLRDVSREEMAVAIARYARTD